MAKQLTATVAISGPTAATSARGRAEAVVVMRRPLETRVEAVTAANLASTELEEEEEERYKEGRREDEISNNKGQSVQRILKHQNSIILYRQKGGTENSFFSFLPFFGTFEKDSIIVQGEVCGLLSGGGKGGA